jgi:hypothetical protein
MAEILADHVEVERCPHDHGAIAAKYGDGVVRAEMQAAEQVVKITKADRARDHAEKASVVAGDAPAEHDGIGAVVQHRAADEQAGVGPVAMNREIFLVAAIFRSRVQRRGVDGQSSLGVEYLNPAKMFRGRGVVEQDQLPDRLSDLIDLRHHHVATARSERS